MSAEKSPTSKRIRKTFWSFVSFALAGAFFWAQPASAFEVAKRYGKEVLTQEHYRIAFADSGLQQKYALLLEDIVRDFNALPCGPILEMTSAQSADILIRAEKIDEGFAAQTERKVKGRRVKGANITLNSRFSFSGQFPTATDALSLGRTLRHEIGHALGLEHSRNKDALMHAATFKNAQGESFAFDDLMAFCHLYQE